MKKFVGEVNGEFLSFASFLDELYERHTFPPLPQANHAFQSQAGPTQSMSARLCTHRHIL